MAVTLDDVDDTPDDLGGHETVEENEVGAGLRSGLRVCVRGGGALFGSRSGNPGEARISAERPPPAGDNSLFGRRELANGRETRPPNEGPSPADPGTAPGETRFPVDWDVTGHSLEGVHPMDPPRNLWPFVRGDRVVSRDGDRRSAMRNNAPPDRQRAGPPYVYSLDIFRGGRRSPTGESAEGEPGESVRGEPGETQSGRDDVDAGEELGARSANWANEAGRRLGFGTHIGVPFPSTSPEVQDPYTVRMGLPRFHSARNNRDASTGSQQAGDRSLAGERIPIEQRVAGESSDSSASRLHDAIGQDSGATGRGMRVRPQMRRHLLGSGTISHPVYDLRGHPGSQPANESSTDWGDEGLCDSSAESSSIELGGGWAEVQDSPEPHPPQSGNAPFFVPLGEARGTNGVDSQLGNGRFFAQGRQSESTNSGAAALRSGNDRLFGQRGQGDDRNLNSATPRLDDDRLFGPRAPHSGEGAAPGNLPPEQRSPNNLPVNNPESRAAPVDRDANRWESAAGEPAWFGRGWADVQDVHIETYDQDWANRNGERPGSANHGFAQLPLLSMTPPRRLGRPPTPDAPVREPAERQPSGPAPRQLDLDQHIF